MTSCGSEWEVFTRISIFLLYILLFLLHITDLSDDAIHDITIYADDSTLYSTSDQASDLWQ